MKKLIGILLLLSSSVALAVEPVAKEDTTPPAADGALTVEQIPPINYADTPRAPATAQPLMNQQQPTQPINSYPGEATQPSMPTAQPSMPTAQPSMTNPSTNTPTFPNNSQPFVNPAQPLNQSNPIQPNQRPANPQPNQQTSQNFNNLQEFMPEQSASNNRSNPGQTAQPKENMMSNIPDSEILND
jgi:hypothetical protein